MPNTQNSWTIRLRDRSLLYARTHLDSPPVPHIPTIMLVDRSPSTPDFAEMLRNMGYRVRQTRDTPPYADDMRNANPDLFVYATDAADRLTWEAIQSIRTESDLPFVPLILYVHRISPSDRRRARFLNVADCLTMPFEEEDLVAAISNSLSREQTFREQQQLFEDQLRHEILGMVQHEFRTPLTFLMGYADYLRDVIDDKPEPQEIKLALEGILEGSHRLHYLVENLILLTELLQRDISSEEVCPIEPMDLWREAVNALNGQRTTQLEGIRLIAPDEPFQIIGAPELISQALVRLLDTTCRHEGAGNRRINLSLTFADEMMGWRAHTEGVQVNGNHERQVVQPYSLDDTSNPLHDLLGLGLAVVEQVARMHGGRVTHESVEGHGTMLTMWLPLTPLPHLRPDSV